MYLPASDTSIFYYPSILISSSFTSSCPPPPVGVMGCGAAEATGLDFVNPCVLSANRVVLGFFCSFHKFSNFTPLPLHWVLNNNLVIVPILFLIINNMYTTGAPDCMKFSIIGRNVNLALFLEKSCRSFGVGGGGITSQGFFVRCKSINFDIAVSLSRNSAFSLTEVNAKTDYTFHKRIFAKNANVYCGKARRKLCTEL